MSVLLVALLDAADPGQRVALLFVGLLVGVLIGAIIAGRR